MSSKETVKDDLEQALDLEPDLDLEVSLHQLTPELMRDNLQMEL